MLIQYLLIDLNDLIFWHCDHLAIRSLGSPIDEHLSKFTDQPHTKLHHSHLIDVLLHGIEYFGDGILVKLRCRGNHSDGL